MKKQDLPKRWRKTIQNVTGYTITYISNVVDGKCPANTDAAKSILEVAEKLAEKHKAEKQEFKRRVAEL